MTLILPVALGCSTSGSIAFSELPSAMQQARCEQLARCGASPDVASCLEFLRVTPDVSLVAAVADDKVRYDGHKGRQCVDAIAEQSCALTASNAHSDPRACSDMYTGILAGGDACSIDPECASGTCELPQTCPERACCVGSCRPTQSVGSAGDACAKDRDCASALICGPDHTCRALAAEGDPCKGDHECASFACVGASATAPGTCRTLPGLHEPCPAMRCASTGLRCDETTFTCVSLGLLGDACTGSSDCAFGLTCDMTAHVCGKYPTLGMPCDDVCMGESFCATDDSGSGTCMALLANGAPCDGNQQCQSDFCEDGPVFRSCINPYVCF